MNQEQVKVHHVNVGKVANYNEFAYRAKAFFDELQLGKFQEFDRDDLIKLKSLQQRAVQYVSYYMKVGLKNWQSCKPIQILSPPPVV